MPVDIDVASEFRYREPVLEPGGLALFISQSGETADTLAALRHARAEQQRIAVVVNVPTSSMAREADLLLPTHAGPEIGVASTKAFTCQLAVLAALAANLARAKGRLSRDEEKEIVAHLQEAPAALNAALGHDDDIAAMAHLIAPARDVLYLGRGPDYPDGARRRAEAQGNQLHPRRGLCRGRDEARPDRADRRRRAGDRARAVRAAVREDRQQHAGSARARRQDRADQRRARASPRPARAAWRRSKCREVHPLIAPLVYAVPVQLLAYHVAVLKGTDVDQPRNLAKSVTVE